MRSKKTEALLKSLFAKDEDGNVYLRVTTTENEPEELTNAVNTQSNLSLESLLSRAIVIDANGNKALCLASVPYGSTIGEAEEKKRLKNAN